MECFLVKHANELKKNTPELGREARKMLFAERELILKALERTHWNRKRAVRDLQISYKSLLYKIKQIGPTLPVPGKREEKS